jgi:hypothetical protein
MNQIPIPGAEIFYDEPSSSPKEATLLFDALLDA